MEVSHRDSLPPRGDRLSPLPTSVSGGRAAPRTVSRKTSGVNRTDTDLRGLFEGKSWRALERDARSIQGSQCQAQSPEEMAEEPLCTLLWIRTGQGSSAEHPPSLQQGLGHVGEKRGSGA